MSEEYCEWASYTQHTQNSLNFEFSCYDWPENYYSEIFKFTEDSCKFRFQFEMTDPIWRSYIRFFIKIRRFWSGKPENFYSSVWEITMNLMTNLNSAIDNLILRTRTWCSDKIHIIPYSFVRNILEGFSHLPCLK